jgi:valyl-tRNA synthetase
MSKSKGNIIDPLSLIGEYGTDALRFAVCQLTGPGRDIKLGAARVSEARSFVTKLWNAARFCEMNGVAPDPAFNPASAQSPLCRWLLDAANQAITEAGDALEAFRFDDYAGACTRFTWNIFCDWFVELAKPTLLGEEGPEKQELRATAAHVLGIILRLLHPATPFVTETLWDEFGFGPPLSLIRAPWPEPAAVHEATPAREEIGWLIRFITAIRTVRAEMNIPPSTKIPVYLRDAAPITLARAKTWENAAGRLARAAAIETAPDPVPQGAAQIVLDEATLILPLAGLIDLAAERARLERERQRAADEIEKVVKKFQNADFVARAKPEVVEENRERERTGRLEVARLDAALARLG